MPSQPKFIEKAKETYKFHRAKLMETEYWTTTKTAKALGRSLGSICEDLLIARFCKDNEDQLAKFDYANEALKYIRDKKKKQELDEID